jgi:soluble lytic murein transglycosylase
LDGVRPVLADPRLQVALSKVETRDYLAAIQILDVGLTTLPAGAPELLPWTYQLARLHGLAKNDERALAAYATVAASDYPLAPYARLALAREAVRRGRLDEGSSLLGKIPDELGNARDVPLLRAEISERRDQCDVALPILRAHLASAPKPPRWPEIATRAARCLLRPGATPEQAEEALRLARRVSISAPTTPFAGTANSQISLALAALPPDARLRLSLPSADEQVDRAQAFFDAGQTAAADAAAKTLEASFTELERGSDAGCRLALLVANVRVKQKQKPKAADAFQIAIDRCQGEARTTALFQGGKASRTAGRAPEAQARFERLEQEAPSHRLADDARLKGAEAARLANDEPRFVAALEKMDEAFPAGDMVSDGLFALALHRIGKNDWAGALSTLERAEKARPRERDYRAAGRTTYFRARALAATGQKDAARLAYTKVVTDYPYTYYMLFAMARLGELDPALAEATRKEAEAKEEPGTIAVTDVPALHTDGFARAVELVRQGQIEEAKGELSALGLYGKDAENDAQWITAVLFGNAGAVTLSHAVPRGKLAAWLDHYPTGRYRKAWEVAYPRPYLDTVTEETKRAGIPLSLAYAIMREESAFDPQVASPAKAFGLMQLILPTAKTMATRRGIPVSVDLLRTPETNVALGCQYLGALRGRFPDCPMLAIPSYNAGPGAPERWLRERPGEDLDLFVERIPYEETRNYTKRVLGSYAAYLALYEPALLPEVLRLPLRARATTGSDVVPADPPAGGEGAAPEAPEN